MLAKLLLLIYHHIRYLVAITPIGPLSNAENDLRRVLIQLGVNPEKAIEMHPLPPDVVYLPLLLEAFQRYNNAKQAYLKEHRGHLVIEMDVDGGGEIIEYRDLSGSRHMTHLDWNTIKDGIQAIEEELPGKDVVDLPDVKAE